MGCAAGCRRERLNAGFRGRWNSPRRVHSAVIMLGTIGCFGAARALIGRDCRPRGIGPPLRDAERSGSLGPSALWLPIGALAFAGSMLRIDHMAGRSENSILGLPLGFSMPRRL